MSGRRPDDRSTTAGDADARFHARVRELVALAGPADALEPRRAVVVAAIVLRETIVHAHNRLVLGNVPAPDVRDLRTIGPEVRATIDAVAVRALADLDARMSDVAAWVANASFAVARRAEWLDADEIPWLVGLACGVGLELSRRDPEVAGRLVEGR